MYCRLLHTHPTVTFPSLFSHHSVKIQTPPNPKHQFTPNHLNPRPHLSSLKQTLKRKFRCIGSTATSGGGTGNWDKWLPRNMIAADKVLRLISGATSSPICQFISSPTTFLHSVDPRIKLWDSGLNIIWVYWVYCPNFWKFDLWKRYMFRSFFQTRIYEKAWLLALVIVPARSHTLTRVGLVVFLALLSIGLLPRQAWMDQLGRVSLLCGILFVMLGLGTDGVPPVIQLRTPPSSLTGLPNVPASLGGYSYIVMKLGPLQLTRKGLSVACTSACLTFTIFQSASLCLTTTTPEQLAFAMQWFMLPLTHFGVPVAEVTLTLLLSLRFINLVFDEVRNVALGIVSRRVNWQQLTVMETIDVFFTYIRRIFKNIFSHAEQITQAMIVRGFRGESNTHKIYFSSESSFGMADFFSLLCLVGLIGATALSENVFL